MFGFVDNATNLYKNVQFYHTFFYNIEQMVLKLQDNVGHRTNSDYHKFRLSFSRKRGNVGFHGRREDSLRKNSRSRPRIS